MVVNDINTSMIGIIRYERKKIYLDSVNKKKQKKVSVLNDKNIKIKNGDVVIVTKTGRIKNRIEEVQIQRHIGTYKTPQIFNLIALEEQNIPINFSDAVIKESQSTPNITMNNRTNLLSLPFITIDPDTAKDHDDAVYAHLDDDPNNHGGYVIYVAIADVSAYVTSLSQMDKEARKRGNSVYLPDLVIPMLPEHISNNLCSLRPNEKRPCIVVRMVIDSKGEKILHEFMRATIYSVAKLTYQQAQRGFDNRPDKEHLPIYESVLKPLWQSYQCMLQARNKRSPLNLDIPEYLIAIDNGKIIDISCPERLESMRLIEEMMIAANVCASQTLVQHQYPLIYRIHDKPSLEKLHILTNFSQSFDKTIHFRPPIRPQSFDPLIDKTINTEYASMIQEAILRTQAQALYSSNNIGHFGLNLSCYTHFTSPIRRYNDLIIHRLLIKALNLGGDGIQQAEIDDLQNIAEYISTTERSAILAERSAKERYLSLYMSDKIGENFKGRISGITRAGLFIKLDITGADGFIPISHLGAERFFLNKDKTKLTGHRTKKQFTLGVNLEVKLVEAKPMTGGLLFSLIQKNASLSRKKKRYKKNDRRLQYR